VSGIVFLQLSLRLCLGVITARVWSLLSVCFYTWVEEWMQFYMSLVHLKTSEFFIIFYIGNLCSQDAILFLSYFRKNILTLTKKKSILYLHSALNKVTQSANQHMHTFNFLFVKTYRYLKFLKTLLHVSVIRPSSGSL